jgi:hypothetical protein
VPASLGLVDMVTSLETKTKQLQKLERARDALRHA